MRPGPAPNSALLPDRGHQPGGSLCPAPWLEVWLPVRVRKAFHWLQGPVFKFLLCNLFIESEAKGVRLGLQNRGSLQRHPEKQREAGCAVRG